MANNLSEGRAPERRLIGGRYRVVAQIGSGGMGTVFRAIDERLKRPVALKLLRLDDADDTDEASYFFHREARAAAALQHPGIIQVFDYSGSAERPAWLVMELLDAFDLADVLQAGVARPPAMIAALIGRVAAALAHAHAQGVIHRDVKPANVLLARGGRTVLADFGLAKAHRDRARLGQTLIERVTQLTGTPDYLAPEQIQASDSSPDSDVFALGCLLYAAAAGRSPFDAADPVEVMNAILAGHYQPLDNLRPDLPSALIDLCHQCLARETYDRPSAKDVSQRCLSELSRAGEHDPEALLAAFVGSLPAARSPRGALRPGPEAEWSLEKKADPGAEGVTDPNIDLTMIEATIIEARRPTRSAVTATGLQGPPRPTRPTPRPPLALGVTVLVAAIGVGILGARLGERGPKSLNPTPPPIVLQQVPRATTPDHSPPPVNHSPDERDTTLVATSVALTDDSEPPAGQRPAAPRPRSRPARSSREPNGTSATSPGSGEPRTDRPSWASMPPSAPARARLAIYVSPWGRVFLDGRLLGNTPAVHIVEAPAGEHLLRIEHPGFAPQERRVVFGKDTAARFELK